MSEKEKEEVAVKEPKPVKSNQHSDSVRGQDGLEAFFRKHMQTVSIAGGALVLVVGFLIYRGLVMLPEGDAQARTEMFFAQQYFEQDSFRKALDGDGNNPGFLDIIDDYSGTKAANLSNYYAGISYLHLKEYQDAIDHLSSFSSDEPFLSTNALSGIGDAYAALNDLDKAIEYYKKAAENEPNELLTPYQLMKVGQALELTGDNKDAETYYEKLKKEYPLSIEGREIDKYIERVRAKIENS